MEQSYDHYIAVDWSIKNMAIARMTAKNNKISVVDVPSDVSELRLYLEQLRGTKVLTLEETTTSQWLYTGRPRSAVTINGGPNGFGWHGKTA